MIRTQRSHIACKGGQANILNHPEGPPILGWASDVPPFLLLLSLLAATQWTTASRHCLRNWNSTVYCGKWRGSSFVPGDPFTHQIASSLCIQLWTVLHLMNEIVIWQFKRVTYMLAWHDITNKGMFAMRMYIYSGYSFNAIDSFHITSIYTL